MIERGVPEIVSFFTTCCASKIFVENKDIATIILKRFFIKKYFYKFKTNKNYTNICYLETLQIKENNTMAIVTAVKFILKTLFLPS